MHAYGGSGSPPGSPTHCPRLESGYSRPTIHASASHRGLLTPTYMAAGLRIAARPACRVHAINGPEDLIDVRQRRGPRLCLAPHSTPPRVTAADVAAEVSHLPCHRRCRWAPLHLAPLQLETLGAPRTLASRARRGLHQLTACPATRAPLRRARRGVDRPPATTTASRKRRRIARAPSLACASSAVDVTARRWLGGVVEAHIRRRGRLADLGVSSTAEIQNLLQERTDTLSIDTREWIKVGMRMRSVGTP